MKTKLTLSVDSEVITQAKRLAQRQGVSVSALFERWSSQLATVSQRPTGASLSKNLRGKWKGQPVQSDDPRLDFLLDKHVRS